MLCTNMLWANMLCTNMVCALCCLAPLRAAPDDPPAEPAEAVEEAPELAVDLSAQLGKVRRVYVDLLTGGETALQMRDLLIASLHRSKLFIVTEDEEKADAVLKGAGEDNIFTDVHNSSDNINAHTQTGGGSGGSTRTGGSRYAGLSIGENESRHSEERRHEAILTVRLVNQDDDVIWSATAESFGGKFLGASADAAEQIAKRLAADTREARGKPKPGGGAMR